MEIGDVLILKKDAVGNMMSDNSPSPRYVLRKGEEVTITDIFGGIIAAETKGGKKVFLWEKDYKD